MSDHDKLWSTFEDGYIDQLHLMKVFQNVAWSHYSLRQFTEALSYFRKAFELATSLQDYQNMVSFKEREGHCLHHLDRLHEALAVQLELSEMQPCVAAPHFQGLIDQLVIATNIPIPLPKIQNLVRNAYDMTRQHGLQASTSMILVLESDLAYFRYAYSESLDKAQESLACHSSYALPTYVEAWHYRKIMDALVALKRINDLKIWIKQLKNLETSIVSLKQLDILRYQSEIALLEKDPQTAWGFAEKHLFRERETGSDCYNSLKLLIRSGIAARKLDMLAGYLLEMGSLRHSERGHMRYEIRYIFGDYYAAMFKRERSRGLFVSQKKVGQYLETAYRYYGWALRIGKEIDMLLECDGRQKEVQAKLNELETCSQ